MSALGGCRRPLGQVGQIGAAQPRDDGGHRPQQGEQVQHDQVAPVGGALQKARLQQLGDGLEALKHPQAGGGGQGDGPGEPVGQPGHHQDEDGGDHRPLFAQPAAQQLIALQRAHGHDQAGHGRHIAQLPDDHGAHHAQQGAQKGAYHAGHYVFLSLFPLFFHLIQPPAQ